MYSESHYHHSQSRNISITPKRGLSLSCLFPPSLGNHWSHSALESLLWTFPVNGAPWRASSSQSLCSWQALTWGFHPSSQLAPPKAHSSGYLVYDPWLGTGNCTSDISLRRCMFVTGDWVSGKDEICFQPGDLAPCRSRKST